MRPMFDCLINKTPENLLLNTTEIITGEDSSNELNSIVNKYKDGLSLLIPEFKSLVESENVEDIESNAFQLGFQLLSNPNYNIEIYKAIEECADEYKLTLIN
jgi:hypothetical protein